MFATEPYLGYINKPGLVIDNPVYEGLGHADPKQSRNLLRQYQPRFLLLPDVRFNFRLTIIRADDYLAVLDSPAVTGVLQGNTLDEVLECALEFYRLGVRRLAVPKDLTERTGVPRSGLVSKILDLRDVKFHLLGAIYPYSDEKFIAAHLPSVLSVDSSEPCNAALARAFYPTTLTARPKDWWFRSGDVLREQQRLRANVQWLRDKLGDLR
jgi:hypothetical protein